MFPLLVLVGCGVLGGDVVGVTGVDVAAECFDTGAAVVDAGWPDEVEPSGCRYEVQAADASGTTLLVFDVPAFADAAAGEPVSATYTLPDDSVRLELETGCGLAAGLCGADDSGISPTVAATYTPTSGTVGVEVTPDGEEATAVLTFTGVELTSEGGDVTTLDGVTWTVTLYDE